MKAMNRILKGLSVAMFGLMTFASHVSGTTIAIGGDGNGTTDKPFLKG
jgi:hypothetical protein